MRNKVPKRNPDIVWKKMGDEVVLLNPETGKYFGLNRVGSSFWSLVDGQVTVDQIIDRMLGEYNVERERIAADILELIGSLEARGLLLWNE